ncbi:MAG: hypothetical protein ABID09_02080 [Candidatus Omnitrophota bacterium]
MKDINKILVVCTGNSCRSVMAEGYLVKRLEETGIKASVMSAGTGTMPGFKPTEETIIVMKEHGVDVSGYTSSSLNKAYVDNADVILVMSRGHREHVLNLSPDEDSKIYYLRDFSSGADQKGNQIADPIGRPIEFYREVFKIIEESIEGFIKWIKE